MSLGERLTNLRKDKKLSQEEVAEKLGVTRQTVSKWETDASTPDFDKIVPICELYGIETNELLTGKEDKKETIINNEENNKKRALGIGGSVMIYIIAVAWLIVAIPYLKINAVVATGIFFAICAIATFIIIYTCVAYKVKEEESNEPNKVLIKRIENVLSSITLIIYLLLSFATSAWHITWIIWPIYALVMEIVKLILALKGKYDEE